MRKVIAILVSNNGEVINFASNEHVEPCKREGYPTGVGYERCDGCNYPNHAEYKVVQGFNGGTLYLIGHTYACEPCTKALEAHGMRLIIIPTERTTNDQISIRPTRSHAPTPLKSSQRKKGQDR